jgi:hypothetical protein
MRNIRITEAGSGGSRGISTGGGRINKTGKKVGKAKPKPTAGKGIFKNINTAGGKRGIAIENKMRKGTSLPKLQTTGKIKSDAREKKYGTPSRKVAKQNDIFVNQYAKYAKKNNTTLKGNAELAKTVAPKSVSAKQKTVPVKKKGK